MKILNTFLISLVVIGIFLITYSFRYQYRTETRTDRWTGKIQWRNSETEKWMNKSEWEEYKKAHYNRLKEEQEEEEIREAKKEEQQKLREIRELENRIQNIPTDVLAKYPICQSLKVLYLKHRKLHPDDLKLLDACFLGDDQRIEFLQLDRGARTRFKRDQEQFYNR